MHDLNFIHEMELGESRQMTSEKSCHYFVTRVPGGWIFCDRTTVAAGYANAIVFVPFNNEFMIR